MDYASLCGIAVGLAMDAFAVCLTNGAITKKVTPAFALKLAFCFGIFQALMPVAGWAIGTAGEGFIHAVDHWVALLLLSYIGINMIWESHRKRKCGVADIRQDDISLKTLLALAAATSIDALATGVILPSAVGASTPLLMLRAVSIIGIITFLLSLFGVFLGKKFGRFLSHGAETFGGIVLIGIGVRIFLDHWL
jgi:putative Mn2+ efflux pump MntP